MSNADSNTYDLPTAPACRHTGRIVRSVDAAGTVHRLCLGCMRDVPFEPKPLVAAVIRRPDWARAALVSGFVLTVGLTWGAILVVVL